MEGVFSLLTVMSLATVACSFNVHIEANTAITCYTCPRMANNSKCNQWAPDIPCPIDNAVCKTVHRISKQTGESIHVDKTCSFPDLCTSEHVGCIDIETRHGTIQECTSCCSTSYCNVAVPSNETTSQKLTHLPANDNTSSCHAISSTWPIVIILSWFAVILSYV